MPLPTEPIGSIPRPPEFIQGIQGFNAGRISRDELNSLYDRAIILVDIPETLTIPLRQTGNMGKFANAKR